MSQSTTPSPARVPHEPDLRSVELLCERLGEMELPIGAEAARGVLREVLALEAPRMEAAVREALQTSIDTIRVAAQSASGVLSSVAPVQTRPKPRAPEPVLDPAPRRPASSPTPRPAPARRSAPRRQPESDGGDDPGGERRPVFRRPRGR
jgi:hypothetical protein